MPRTTKLNDLQRVLLASAAARPNGNLLPAPDSIADQAARLVETIPTLLKRMLIAERPATDAACAWREEGGSRIGLFITDAGRAAIDAPVASGVPAAITVPEPAMTGGKLKPGSKAACVLALLGRTEGASLTQLVEATGWLPHTTRAALTGLRKKGHAVISTKEGVVRTYRITAVEAA